MPVIDINLTRSRFEAKLARISDFAQESRLYKRTLASGDVEKIPPRTVELLQCLALLRLIIEWDCFLEETFVKYLKGAQTRAGYAPTLTSTAQTQLSSTRPRTMHDVKQFIIQSEGMPFYVKWDGPSTQTRGRRFFLGGQPYDDLGGWQQVLLDMNVLRNDFVHKSGYSRTEFEKLLRREYTPPPRGMTPGRLLMFPHPRDPTKTWLQYFELCVQDLTPKIVRY